MEDAEAGLERDQPGLHDAEPCHSAGPEEQGREVSGSSLRIGGEEGLRLSLLLQAAAQQQRRNVVRVHRARVKPLLRPRQHSSQVQQCQCHDRRAQRGRSRGGATREHSAHSVEQIAQAKVRKIVVGEMR